MELRREKVVTPARGQDASYPRGRLASPLDKACYPRRKLASPLDEACYEEIDVNSNLTGGSGSNFYQNILPEDSEGYVEIQQTAAEDEAEDEAEVYENITFHQQSYEVMELGGTADPYVVMSPLRRHRLVTAV